MTVRQMMALGMLVVLYVCARFGFECAGSAGAVAVVALFAAAELILTITTRPLEA